MDNADSRNKSGFNKIGAVSVLGKGKNVDGSVGGLVKTYKGIGGGMGVANYTRTAKKVPNNGAILSGDAK